jgi:hypothetical protein
MRWVGLAEGDEISSISVSLKKGIIASRDGSVQYSNFCGQKKVGNAAVALDSVPFMVKS